MFRKIGAFFKEFFGNVKADPVSSVKGLVQIAAAGGVAYGMATGVVPVTVGAPIAASFATSGIHALGTNSATGVTAPLAVKTESLLTATSSQVPTVLSVMEQVKYIQGEADAGQKKIDAYQAVTDALAAIAPPPAVNQGQ